MLGVLLYSLLIPPTSLLWPLALGLLARRYRVGRVVAWLALAGLIVFGMPATAGGLNRLIALRPMLPTAPPPQAIVVLSAERRFGLPGGVMEGEDIGPMTTERVRAGVQLAKRTGLPVLVSGGVLSAGTPPIADSMARVMADEFATKVRWRENRSLDTWQNAVFSAQMLKAEGVTSVYLVTTSWHMARSVLAFEKAGMLVTPTPVRTPDAVGGELADYIPQARGWQASYYAMHEVIGFVWYKLRTK